MRETGTTEEQGRWVKAVVRTPKVVFGGDVVGVSEKEKQRWEAKHPVPVAVSGTTGGVVKGNGTGAAAGASDDGDGGGTDDVSGVESYTSKNGVGKGVHLNCGRGWVGVLVVLAVGGVGLGF